MKLNLCSYQLTILLLLTFFYWKIKRMVNIVNIVKIIDSVLVTKSALYRSIYKSRFNNSLFFFSLEEKPPVIRWMKKWSKKVKTILGCMKLNTCYWFKQNVKRRIKSIWRFISTYWICYYMYMNIWMYVHKYCSFVNVTLKYLNYQNCYSQLTLRGCILTICNKNINHYIYIII